MQLPWLNYLLVNAPDPYYGGFAWYDIGQIRDRASSAAASCSLNCWITTRGQGFSGRENDCVWFFQGCLMSIEIGARYPHRLAGIVGISGYVHEPERLVATFAPGPPQRFLITHGTHDPLIPIIQVRPQMELLRRRA
jgi:phospholipase/carboxylesterase